MDYRPLGKTGLKISALSLGASALGGVFGAVDTAEGRRIVRAALDAGINFFDVAPAYGATRAEMVLGAALRDIPRDGYFLSTKVGKYTAPGGYGADTFDYSSKRIAASLEESGARLGTDYFDLILLHDLEYQGQSSTEWALGEGLDTLHELKRAGRIGAVGVGTYPVGLWRRILSDFNIDVALVHNHHCLYDTRLLELLPIAERRHVGVVNASPFGSGLLTDQGPPEWHPAGPADRAVFRRAAEYCRTHGTSISKVALQFAAARREIPTTMFSATDAASVRLNIDWYLEPADGALLDQVRTMLAPVIDRQWSYQAENPQPQNDLQHPH